MEKYSIVEYFNSFYSFYSVEKKSFPFGLNYKLWNIVMLKILYSRSFNNTHVEEDSNIGYFIVSKEILYNIVVSSFRFIPYAFCVPLCSTAILIYQNIRRAAVQFISSLLLHISCKYIFPCNWMEY